MTEPKRIILSPALSAEIHTLAQLHGYNDTDFINLCTSLTKMIFEERAQGNTLILVNANGEPAMQIVPPTAQQMRSPGDSKTEGSDSHSRSLWNSIADLDPDRPNRKDEGWNR